MSINPSFLRFPEEAAAVGRLLAAFGELEVSICYNASKATGLGDAALCALYRVRSTSARIDAADGLMRPVYVRNNLSEPYADAINRVDHCRSIRNQFAHCNWGDHQDGGLFFADLQKSAATPDFWLRWKHIDVSLLTSQETYFGAALEALRFLENELAVRQGTLKSHAWPTPPMLERPPLHNPEEKHIPPWLGSSERDRYLMRLQESGRIAPSPAQLAQEARRAQKKAQRQADRDRDLAKRLSGEPEK